MFLSLYTDKAKGILNEQRFVKLTAVLEQEQEANQKRLHDLAVMQSRADCAGKRSPHLYQGNPALCRHRGTGRGGAEPAHQPDSDWRGQKGGRQKGAGSQDRV